MLCHFLNRNSCISHGDPMTAKLKHRLIVDAVTDNRCILPADPKEARQFSQRPPLIGRLAVQFKVIIP